MQLTIHDVLQKTMDVKLLFLLLLTNSCCLFLALCGFQSCDRKLDSSVALIGHDKIMQPRNSCYPI